MSERVRSASRGRHDPSDTAVHLLSFDGVAGAPTCRAAEHEGGLRLHTVFVERVTCLACLNEINEHLAGLRHRALLQRLRFLDDLRDARPPPRQA